MSSKIEMLIFGLCSTSDDWLSILSDKSRPKCKKSPAISLKNEMLIFGLRSTSDDWLSNESQPKCKKRSPMSLKNEMFIFRLRSTSDDRPSDLSNKHRPKCKKRKRPPKSSKMKCSFMDYVQIPMIGQVIQATNINLNAKK